MTYFCYQFLFSLFVHNSPQKSKEYLIPVHAAATLLCAHTELCPPQPNPFTKWYPGSKRCL